MFAQDIFDKTVRMLAAQGGPSTSADGSCKYRNSVGKKCAVGLWISDAAYDDAFEGIAVDVEHELCKKLKEALPSGLLNHLPLLKKMQEAHDYGSSTVTAKDGRIWVRIDAIGDRSIRTRLLQICADRGLHPEVVDECFPPGCGDCGATRPCWNATIKCCKENTP